MTYTNSTPLFYCPMHSDVRQRLAGDCPCCGMPLIPVGAPFAMLRHLLSNPVHFVMMVTFVVAVMAMTTISP